VIRYDPFQLEAMKYISQGLSVIVSAPTGAGKTVIAEHVINDCLQKGQRVIYTAPIKALSNQKYRDFQLTARDRIGILTGDVTLNPDAPLLIMTTEIFRNKILEERSSLDEYRWIIFDEIHYIDDYERGSVWEESLIFLPNHMNFLGLSATIPNVNEFARWIETIHKKPVQVVIEEKRPVPLHFYYQSQGKIYDDYREVAKRGFSTLEGYGGGKGRLSRSLKLSPNQAPALIKYLADKDMLPCIYFVFSRRRTEYLADELESYDFLNPEEKERIRALYDDLCRRFDLTGDPRTERLKFLVERGIAYHHAGMLPTLKEVIERLFTSRLLKVIFTTETFALGINMPARSVIFDELRKFYGWGFATLRTRDFYQMAGRAGRRAIDTEGFVFCRINPHDISPQELHRVIFSSPEEVKSQLNTSYATLLNLYQHYGENLYDVYPQSFHYFQVKAPLRKEAVEYLRAKVNILKELGHIRKNKVTEKGQFASKVYGYELILAEIYDEGIMEGMSETELGVLALAAVYEARKGTAKPRLSQKADRLEHVTKRILRHVHRLEKTVGLSQFQKRFHFHLSPALEAWLRGEEFGDILKYTDADEGEVVRYFRMALQILREIQEAPVSDKLKNRIHQLLSRLNRDVIDSEKQLRIE
jgi:superfamily II RNA helicase